MDKYRLAKHLKEARESVGLSQEVVAQALHIPRTALTQLESGARAVSTLELVKLASLYHRSVQSFVEGSFEKEGVVALYRADPSIKKNRAIQQQLDRIVLLCQEGALLKKILAHPNWQRLPDYGSNMQGKLMDEIYRAEHAAHQERGRLGLGYAPVINIADLLIKQGVWVSSEADWDDKISGMCLQHQSIGAFILVNANHTVRRQRFSFAHEYAHLLFDGHQRFNISMDDDFKKLADKRANAFAAAFLMPADGIASLLKNLNKGQHSHVEQVIFSESKNKAVHAVMRTDAKLQAITYQDIAILASYFGVSYQATVYRLLSLRYCSKSASDALLSKTDLGNAYLRSLDMFDLQDTVHKVASRPSPLDAQIQYFASEAYRLGEISGGKLRDISALLKIPIEKMCLSLPTEFIH